ncbi:MAG TPA: sorbosone dehydrogenase family protein [Burkholderiaceae bacterium]|nr:sorbosone dehydrogenase family protein [Burkholderiaceae bacterium]
MPALLIPSSDSCQQFSAIRRARAVVTALCIALITFWSPAHAALLLDRIKLPKGFQIEVYSDKVPGARAMTLSPSGTLFVGSRAEGKVYALRPGEPVRIVASGLNMPAGVAFHDGALYASSVSRIVRLDDIERRLDNPPTPVVVTDRFPTETHHGWKFIAFGPDGYLYVPVGAPCNVCERDENRYANIMKMKPDGTDLQVVARGVRNTVGFDWHPVTSELWFTDNGRDMMGDDLPDCELNRLSQPGQHFGFPYCHAGVPDPQFGKGRACSTFVAPVAKLGPHVAPLGMRFYTGKQFPADYRNNILIAEHGSWNRSKRIGYRVKRVVIDDAGKLVRQEVFAEGWLQGETPWGRPADVLVMPDGALLVSDDMAGVIYRISYRP